jgi:hypothetical protein
MKKSILMSFLFLQIAFRCYSQNQKLYFCVEDNNLVSNSPLQLRFVKANNLSNVVILYQDDFVTHNVKADFKMDLLRKSIAKKIPNKEQTGLAILDWEGRKPRILYGGIQTTEDEYNRILNEFISAIKEAKAQRPNMQWSFYGMPVRVGGSPSYDVWRSRILRMMPLFQNCDFISPSLYSFIRNDTSKYLADVNQHLKLSLEIGKKLNKPVMPFIWHRYQTNSSLVPINEFNNHIQQILNYTYQGSKVNGLIWWNSEGFLNIRKQKYPKVAQEYRIAQNADDYQKNVFDEYYNGIKNLFNKK